MYTLLDSNIVIYALTEGSLKKIASQDFIRTNQEILCVSHQVILESLRILTHPKFKNPMDSSSALKAVWAIADVLTIVSPNFDTLMVTRELIRKYKLESNRIFDAYLAATALSNSIEIIATDNTKHFQMYRQIGIINPFEDV